jgi:hypothetical protein
MQASRVIFQVVGALQNFCNLILQRESASASCFNPKKCPQNNLERRRRWWLATSSTVPTLIYTNWGKMPEFTTKIPTTVEFKQ